MQVTPHGKTSPELLAEEAGKRRRLGGWNFQGPVVPVRHLHLPISKPHEATSGSLPSQSFLFLLNVIESYNVLVRMQIRIVELPGVPGCPFVVHLMPLQSEYCIDASVQVKTARKKGRLMTAYDKLVVE